MVECNAVHPAGEDDGGVGAGGVGGQRQDLRRVQHDYGEGKELHIRGKSYVEKVFGEDTYYSHSAVFAIRPELYH